MRSKISAVIFDTKKDNDYSKVKTSFYKENEDFDLRVVNSGDATEEKLLSILSSMKGFDSIITIGENPYIEFLNRMPFYIRKKWYHFDEFNAEAVTNSIIGTLSANINRKDKGFPLFSIFTCAYKTDKEKALRLYNSLLKQTYKEWDWLIIDDSPYPYESYFKKIKDPRIHIIKNENTHGNIGFNKHVIGMACDGDYLVEVDHDDELTSDCLLLLKKAFDTYPDIGFAYSYAREEVGGETIFYGDYFALGLGKTEECGIEDKKMLIPITPDVNVLSIHHVVSLPNHVRCWKAETYRELGGHNVDLSILDDQDLLTRTLLKYKACKIPKILYIQHEGERSEGERGGTSTQTVRFDEICRLGYILRDKYDKEIHETFLKWGLEDPYWDENEKRSKIFDGVKPNTVNINYVLDI